MKHIILGLVALASASAVNAVELVKNGSFTEAAGGVAGLGQNSTYITDWKVKGGSNALAWYYPAGTADNNNVTAKIYGPGNGVANGYTLSPDGGAMVALDGATTFQAKLTQTITGLTPGKKYALRFYWAGGQQAGFSGTTTEQFVVDFGSETRSTAVWNNPTKGFSGWYTENYTFTATTASQVLSFLAVGTPDGQPPFSLLDGVSLQEVTAVPEPATWALMIAGFGMVGFAARRRRVGVAA